MQVGNSHANEGGGYALFQVDLRRSFRSAISFSCSAISALILLDPPMPRIVAHGRDDAWACAYCHLPNGQGRPENAPLAGLPAAYIVEQVNAQSCGAPAERRSRHLAFLRPVSSSALRSSKSTRPSKQRLIDDARVRRVPRFRAIKHRQERTAGAPCPSRGEMP